MYTKSVQEGVRDYLTNKVDNERYTNDFQYQSGVDLAKRDEQKRRDPKTFYQKELKTIKIYVEHLERMLLQETYDPIAVDSIKTSIEQLEEAAKHIDWKHNASVTFEVDGETIIKTEEGNNKITYDDLVKTWKQVYDEKEMSDTSNFLQQIFDSDS